MITKTSIRIIKVLSVVAATLALGACSGSQQDDEQLDAEENSQQANLGEDDAAEGNGQENYGDNQGGNQQYQQDQGAEVNNATEEEEGDQSANINPTLDDSAAMAPANPAPVQAAPVADMAPPAAAPAAATAESPVPGGRVRYVREGGIQVMNAPGGTPVLTLDQGEHPVTWEENGWLRITNGMYVPVDGMSDKGVPRPGHALTH